MIDARDILKFSFQSETFAGSFSLRKSDESALARLDRIRQKHSGVTGTPKIETIQETVKLFNQAIKDNNLSEFSSSRRSLRLSWGLTDIMNTPNLAIALKIIEQFDQPRSLMGVFDALLKNWGHESITLLQQHLRKRLQVYDGKLRFLQKIKSVQDFFLDRDGITKLVLSLKRSQVPLANVWNWLGLPDNMRGYSYFGDLVIAYVQLTSSISYSFLNEIIEFLKIYNVDEKNKIVISHLIEKLGDDADEQLRVPVQNCALEKWFDPRITGGTIRWRGISETAKNILIRWLTKEDLVFFFDVVAKTCNDKKFNDRKKFWLSYLENISLCRPVLRKDTRLYFTDDPQVLQYYQKRRPATLLGGTVDQHAFIIQIKDFVFVEFSTAGACYVYQRSNCPFLLDQSQYRMEMFRDQTRAVYREMHRGSWEYRLSWWIKNYIGIESGRSWYYY